MFDLITKSIARVATSAGHYSLAGCPATITPRQLLLDPTMMSRSLLILTMIVQLTFAGCPFGNPFYFVDIPRVNRVANVEGEEVPDRWVDFSIIVYSLDCLVSPELESAGGR